MSISSDPTKFTETHSFSMWALANVTDWYESNAAQTSKVTKVLKLIITETVTTLLIPVALIEGIVQAIISLLVKTVHFFIPEKKSEWFTKNIYIPTVYGTVYSFMTIPYGAISLVSNIKGEKSCESTMNAMDKVFYKSVEPFTEFAKVHIDTLCYRL